MTTRSSIRPQVADYAHLAPLPDPPREPDMQQHEGIFSFHGILSPYFAHRDDVLISGAGYLRREATNDAERLAPDCVVAFGVNPRGIISRNGYVISEVGKPPDFVLEIASRSTGRRDYTVKRERYAAYGVREYWRFDHSGGRFHDAPLAGDVLVNGKYERVQIHREFDGLLWGHSEVLGLDLCWDDGKLRLRVPETGEFLPTPEELLGERDVAEAERDAAEERADTERTGRLAAEAELARVREQLYRMQQE